MPVVVKLEELTEEQESDTVKAVKSEREKGRRLPKRRLIQQIWWLKQ